MIEMFESDSVKQKGINDTIMALVKAMSIPEMALEIREHEERREVSTENGKKFCKDNALHLFLETSAKTGTNVKEVFTNAAKILYSEHTKYRSRVSRPDSFIKYPPSAEEDQDIIENEEDGQQPRKKGCCSG